MTNNFFESFDHINLNIKNLPESIAWYSDVFGFQVVEEGKSDDGPWAILRNKESMLCLYQVQDFEKLKNERYNHLGFRINNKEAWEEVVKQLTIPVMYGGAYRYPHSTSWYIEDPSGYEIEVAYWDENKIRF